MRNKYNLRAGDPPLKKLSMAQRGTVNDLMEMLNKHQIAMMVRPTGFGKTHIMIDLAKKEKYTKVLYLYPLEVIRNSIYDSYHTIGEDGSMENFKFADSPEEHEKYPNLPYIEFCTYAKMRRDFGSAYKFVDVDWEKLSDKEKDELRSNWQSMDSAKKARIQKKFIEQRFQDIELLILDEAHTVGAEKFLEYWPYIHAMTYKGAKSNRLHVLGATATPLRTDPKIDIEKEVFYYTRGDKKYSARIQDFTMIDCWKLGILLNPFYTKGLLDTEEQRIKLSKVLYDNMVGKDRLGAEPTKRGRKPSKSGEVRVLYNPYVNRQKKLYEEELRKLNLALDGLKTPSELIYSAIEDNFRYKIESGAYMRFLVFYQNSQDLIDYHDKIHQAFIDAFSVGSDNSMYNKVNSTYIVSVKDRLESAGLEVSGVDSITNRDAQKKKDPESVVGNIDLVHSVNMLNMGYHVGDVTGVVIKRASESEIKYYQQIGRGISVKKNETPIIIDFANADAELFRKSYDTLRDEASERIQEFIGGCKQSEDCLVVNNIFKMVNMHVALDKLPDDMLEYLYFDRKAPIYFIKGIAESLKCDESIDSLVSRIYNIAKRVGFESFVFDDFALSLDRIDQKLIGTASNPGVLLKELKIAAQLENKQ